MTQIKSAQAAGPVQLKVVSSASKPKRRPTTITGGWLPADPTDRLIWLREFSKDIEKERSEDGCRTHKTLNPSVQELKNLIEDDPELSMLFCTMFDEVQHTRRVDSMGEFYDVASFETLLDLFSGLLDQPPKFNEDIMVAFPFTLLLEWPLSTRSGLAASLNKELNVKLGNILNEWGRYLADPSKNSKDVIINQPDLSSSWLSTSARNIMQGGDPTNRTFEELYKCTPGDIHLGFTCWDHFFTRQFRDGVRPVEDTSDNTITSGCESTPYAIKQKVAFKEKFWLKGRPYSLKHMLKSDEDARKFEGGTIYQAYLTPFTYHRWHSPINGVITKLRLIEGTYFSVSPINAPPDPEVYRGSTSQPYLTSVATRALIYMNNAVVGDMVMLAVGMVEVSTCAFNPKILERMTRDLRSDPTGNTYLPKADSTPIKVSKGDELGMFHFGGSTWCLVFGPDVQLKFWRRACPLDNEEDEAIVPLNAIIADVVQVTAVNSLYPV